MSGPDPYARASEAATTLGERTGVARHDVAVVLGSGWAAAVDGLGRAASTLDAVELGGAPAGVEGHAGTVHSLERPGGRVLVFVGRVHAYEGHDLDAVVHPVRTAAAAGCHSVVLTNAAGGIDPAYRVGQPVLVCDHLNLTGRSPLAGPPPPAPWPGRFVDLTDLYTAALRDAVAVAAAGLLGEPIAQGVYAGLPGPHYETPAEIRMLASLGADLVGMSTVHEAVAARHAGLAVLGISLVTNPAAGVTGGSLDHLEVVAAGRAATGVLSGLLAVAVDVALTLPPPVTPVPPALRREVEAWIAADPDGGDRDALTVLLGRAGGGDADAADDLAGRFGGRLHFGTAGLRAPVGAGPLRLNRAVVRATTAGVAAWLGAAVDDAARRGVVVGCDARHRSADLWAETARVLAGAGLRVHLLDAGQPTPLVAFATRHLGAAAGVMITASHNPAADNGYKLYLADGAQVLPPADAEIESAVAAVDLARVTVAGLDDPLVCRPGAVVVDAYLTATVAATTRRADRSRPVRPVRPVRAVHTALHGVSTDLLDAGVARAGYAPLHHVDAQARPDPDFPTVVWPNPEEPGALDLALAAAVAIDADVVLANDPDGDRLAVAVPARAADARGGGAGRGDGWRVLTGDELGAVLGGAVLDGSLPGLEGPGIPVVASSLVSAGLLAAAATAAGVRHVETLTGFKWIARAADAVDGGRLVFGYEEALGYALGDAVRDKDGIAAAVAVLALMAGGRPLLERLDDLERRHGVHATRQVSRRLASPDAAAAVVARLRASPPTELAGMAVRHVVDHAGGGAGLPAADVVVWRLDGGRVVLRPSGTEPKLKAYLEAVAPPGGPLAQARASAAATLDRMGAAVGALLDGANR